MKARWYEPEIGRFISPDTIVPDPTNPQSFNRYSYTFNNSVNHTDPDGHNPAWCNDPYDSGGGADCAPMVDFSVNDGANAWTVKERFVVMLAAAKIDFALSRHGAGFLKVYGGTVNFRKTGVLAGNLGEAISQTEIIVNEQIDGATVVGLGTMWAAHELGHAFNNALSPNTTQPDFAHGQGLIDLATEGVRVNGVLISGAIDSTSWLGTYKRDFEGYRSETSPHVQNPLHTASEDFGDMFSNYIHNSFASNDYGQARYDFMSNHMRNWVSLAVSNNE